LRLTTYADGTQELYNHATDPNEWTNLVADLSYSDELAMLESMSPFSDDPAPESSVFTFLNGGPLDAVGIGGNMTVDGVTITTQDVIGLGGTRASDGINDTTNIGNTGGLGINSAANDTARNFESGEGWEFTFNTDVRLQNMDLLLTSAVCGEPQVTILDRLGALVSIFYSHTDPEADGPRIISLSVGEVEAVNCALGDVNQDGNVDFLDISPFITALSTGAFSCEADIDQNGTVDFLDISPFRI